MPLRIVQASSGMQFRFSLQARHVCGAPKLPWERDAPPTNRPHIRVLKKQGIFADRNLLEHGYAHPPLCLGPRYRVAAAMLLVESGIADFLVWDYARLFLHKPKPSLAYKKIWRRALLRWWRLLALLSISYRLRVVAWRQGVKQGSTA